MESTNHIKIRKFSLFYEHYLYLDTVDYHADQIFINNKVRVIFGKEFLNSGDGKYVAIFCKVRKRDRELFLKSMGNLYNKMIILRDITYQEMCKDLFSRCEDLERKRSGELEEC